MNNERRKMFERVRAILSKTIANGCTEGEALAALEKARELMAAYDIADVDLDVTNKEGATIHKMDLSDPYDIKRSLAVAVGRFMRCKVWNGVNAGYGVAFCGLESDVSFATWLLVTLQQFVMRELKEYQARRRSQGVTCRRVIGSSFVLGCTQRISDRLEELTPMDPEGTPVNGLVISRNALIDAAMTAAGINLRKARARSRRLDATSHEAGIAAGNAARFDRPVPTGGKLSLASSKLRPE